MDDYEKNMFVNTLKFKKTLDRITEKYSKVSEREGAIDVHLEHVNMKDIQRYIAVSEAEMFRIEAESPSSGREYSFRDGNTTNYSQIKCPAEETNELIESNESIMDGASEMEQTQASMDLLDDTQGNLTEVLVQPEDQDEDLERTLSSHGNTLIELYPQMISQIGKARHRQHVSEAADSVLWRYRRMRRTNGNANPKPAPRGDRRHHHHSRSCDVHHPKAAVKSSSTVFHSPARRQSDRPEPLQEWRASPGREVDQARTDQQRPIRVMDFYSLEPSQAPMNQTFTVSKGSPRSSPLSGRPRRQSYSPADRSPGPPLRFNRSNGPPVIDSSTVPSSPVRPQGLFKTKWGNQQGYGGSPDAFARRSNSDSLEGFSREAKQARYNPASPSIHKYPPLSPRRSLYHQDCHSSSRPRSESPRSTGSTRFQRHHSFDSSLQPGRVTYSPAKLDEEFIKFYHKYVCQGKCSLYDSFPSHRCAALEASRGRSSSTSTLSALALSPHRSVLRKRLRELDHDGSPRSKRPRECISSPGSLRHRQENLRSSRVPLLYKFRVPLLYKFGVPGGKYVP